MYHVSLLDSAKYIFKFSSKDMFIDFKERGRKRKKGREN